jgi:hypothetical protein
MGRLSLSRDKDMKSFYGLNWLLLALVGIAPLAHAQAAPREIDKIVPKEPLVPTLPGRAEYEVLYFYDFGADWESSTKWRASSKSTSHQIEAVSISVDSATQTSRVVTKWSNGKTFAEWYLKGLRLAPMGEGKGYDLIGPAIGPAGGGFDELGWVNIAAFKGVGKLGEKLVFVFRQSVGKGVPGKERKQPAQDANNPGEEERTSYRTTEKVVYLDVETQLPMLSNDGQVIRMYRILPAPADKLEAPQELHDLLKKWQSTIRDRVASPGNPAG